MSKLKKFDFLVIMLLLVSAVFLFLKFSNADSPVMGTGGEVYESARLKYVIRDVRFMTAEAFNVGDTLLSDETHHKVGVITDIEIRPYEKALEKVDGTLVQAEVPEKFTVVLTVETDLIQRRIGYFAHGITEIKINSTAVIYTKYVRTVSKVEEIRFEN